MRRKKLIDKKQFKRRVSQCMICDTKDTCTLQVHRWKIQGKDKGKYSPGNVACLCGNCHSKCHSGLITIKGIHQSTTGGSVIIFIDQNGIQKINGPFFIA